MRKDRISPVIIASFLYHDVTDDPTDSGFQRPSAIPYKHKVSDFSKNLDQIGTSFLTPELVVDIDFKKPEKHLMLTFDDGGKSALHVGTELGKRGWKGHFFVITSRIGSRNFLNAEDIRYLRSCGHQIGSHSHTHPDIFNSLSSQEMMEEWNVSRDILSQTLNEPCVMASVPGGDISLTVLKSVAAAGFQYLFTSEPWLQPRAEENCWVLGRICPKVGTRLSRVHDYAHFRGWRRALAVRKSKVMVKTVLAPLYRYYVRRTRDERLA